ncbi:MAG: hypothetical protein J5I98_09515 [Phaeodactylibacter sp.]|nr:hypothetical protein [Phaeodactylibacter sp.]
MMTRIRYLATTPFSFRREQATTKFAATYPCPTPYAAKVALVVGAIRAGLSPEEFVKKLRKVKVQIHPWGEGVINTHMVKHYEVPRSDGSGRDLPPGYLSSTVVFREFLYFDGGVDLFVPTEELEWLQPALPGVNCFGKQGSFFSLYSVEEAEPPEGGISFTGSDFKSNATWQKISNFQGVTNKPREEVAFKVNMQISGGGQNYAHITFGS